jgi:signal transduction histidine kinase
VRDDGAGFDPHARRRLNGRARGLGLGGMRERALLVGGNLEVQAAPGAGTTIELTMGVT